MNSERKQDGHQPQNSVTPSSLQDPGELNDRESVEHADPVTAAERRLEKKGIDDQVYGPDHRRDVPSMEQRTDPLIWFKQTHPKEQSRYISLDEFRKLVSASGPFVVENGEVRKQLFQVSFKVNNSPRIMFAMGIARNTIEIFNLEIDVLGLKIRVDYDEGWGYMQFEILERRNNVADER